jgi:hypothetical protein
MPIVEAFVSRRAALAALGAGGLMMAFASPVRRAAAQGTHSAADAELVELIRATERERLRAFVGADMPVLERLHTEDFQLINPGGGALSKAEYLGGVAAGDIDYLVWAPTSEIVVRLYGEAAAIRYRSHTEIVVFGETIVVENWHTDVYERHDGRWQAVWSHATSVQ